MKDTKYILFIIFLIFINIFHVEASCSNEELMSENEVASKIKITYKHLGEVTKEDGAKVYNEFLVNASNIEAGLFIHLSPMTNENFIENENNIQIKLTTGTWIYSIYSSKCEKVVKDITVKLPKFNTYSLDPMCERIDGEDFPLCAKYYEYELSRETFERKVKAYRLENNIDEENIIAHKEKIINRIMDFIKKYNFYIVGILVTILLVLIIIIIKSRREKKKVLE